MAFKVPEDAYETSQSSGTGDVTMDGAKLRHRAFDAAGMTNGDVCRVRFQHKNLNQVECCYGTWTTGGVFVRGAILYSTNGGARVDFSAGGLNVFSPLAGDDLIWKNSSGLIDQDLKFPDATRDIGQSGANRPRDGFFSRNLTVGSGVTAGFGLFSSSVGVAYHGAGRMTVSAAGSFEFGSSGLTSPDAFITRGGAADVQLGAADAAAPVAQTMSAQSVVAGTTNTAGASRTYDGSQSTGSAAGGSHIFRVSPAGGSGSSQNALSAALTISTTSVAVATGLTLSINGTPVKKLGTNWIDNDNGTSAGWSYLYGGANSVGIGINATDGHRGLFNGPTNVVAWGSSQGPNGTSDTILTRGGAAATVRQGAADAASPVVQTFSVQSVVAGTTNTAGANRIYSASQGTGSAVGGVHTFKVAPAGSSGSAQNALVDAVVIDSAVGLTLGSGFCLAGVEQTAPAAPAANGFKIFAEDNGAGKTRLMALFASGAAQQLAIEP